MNKPSFWIKQGFSPEYYWVVKDGIKTNPNSDTRADEINSVCILGAIKCCRYFGTLDAEAAVNMRDEIATHIVNHIGTDVSAFGTSGQIIVNYNDNSKTTQNKAVKLLVKLGL